METTRVFGPVPSRRLGKSIGINNIPPKICTYSCAYCQLGRSLRMTAERQAYYEPDELLREVQAKITNAQANHEAIDYLTIVPDGEPTLDLHLETLIQGLRPLGFKVAVITNATFLHLPAVRQALCGADWVSVKVDAVDEGVWRKIDRPHRGFSFNGLLEGIQAFSQEYGGQLVTETMLVKNINDDMQHLRHVAEFIRELRGVSTAYLSIPTRPPAETWVEAPDEEQINRAYQTFREHEIPVEYLIGYEGNEFAYTGNIEEDLLSITSVHPMREDAVSAYLEKAGGNFSAVENMVRDNKLVVSQYQEERFYVRKFPGRHVSART